MADEFSWVQDAAGTAASGAYDVVLILVVLAVFAAGAGFLIWFMSYKHEVIIRYLTKNRKFIIKDRARIVKEDGVKMWRLLKMKEIVKPPRPECIEITKRGKFFAECYWSEENPSPTWLEDRGESSDAFSKYAFTADERAFYVTRMRKALERKATTGWEKFMQIALPATMIIIIAIPFIFWGNLTEESTKMAQANAATAAQVNTNLENMNQISGNFARLLEVSDIKIEQHIPPDAPANTPPEVTG